MAIEVPRFPGIYCRLSYAPDGSIENVERQESDARALGARLGWPAPTGRHVFRDNNRSAWQRNRKRPGWDAMLAAVELGEVDGIIVYHGDRLVRQPWDLELLLRLSDDLHLPLASVSGLRDLSSEDDRFILRIEVAHACRSSGDTSRRVRDKWATRAAAGRPVGGGKRPFGFEPDRVTRREPEAAILREAAERLLAGQSQAGVLRWLRETCTTSQDCQWSRRTLIHLLRAPRIAGLVAHGGQLYTAVWEPIISREQWEDVVLLLDQSSRDYPHPGQERRYLLSGVAECGACWARVVTKPSGGKNRPTARIYFCPACRAVGRNVDLLDAYVSGRVVRLLNSERFLRELYADDDRPGIAAEIAALERRQRETKETLENLADFPDVDPGLIARSLASFDRRVAELRDRQATTTSQRLLQRMAGISREDWDAEPVDVRAATVRALYRVIVLPTTRRGPGFDPDAVRLIRAGAAGG